MPERRYPRKTRKDQGSYEKWFKKLQEDVAGVGSKMIALYLPSGDKDVFRDFYLNLCKKYNIEFIDASLEMRQHDPKDIFLLPFNGHLSRYGNRLVAKILLAAFEKYQFSKIQHPLQHPSTEVWGNLSPNSNGIWDVSPDAPYRVFVDKHGFRLKNNLYEERKFKVPNILFLGDSFTFGPYLPNHDTYPEILMQESDKYYAMNAGMSGYTIRDEEILFSTKAKFSNPDIVVVQMLDNDISDLFFFKQNRLFQKNKDFSHPSPAEIRFFQKLGIEGVSP